MDRNEDSGGPLADALGRVEPNAHMCLIYESQEEQFAAAVPFVRLGLERGEQCIYMAEENSVDTVLAAMRGDGFDVDAAVRSGAFKVTTEKETYLKEGSFDPDRMLRFWREAADSAEAAGFRGLRATGEMTWALQNGLRFEGLTEYETRLNEFIPAHPVSALCQYNRRRFSPELLVEAIRTHPQLVFNDTVCTNPYYKAPEGFLESTEPRQELQRLLDTILEQQRPKHARRHDEESPGPASDANSEDSMLDLVTPYVDGELPKAVADRVARHIKGDPELRRLVAVERATKRAVSTLTSRHSAPVHLEARVRAAVFGTAGSGVGDAPAADAPAADAPAADPKPARPSLWRLLSRSPAYASAAAALALGVALAVAITLFSGRRITPFVADVYAHHTDLERFPVRFEGDRAAVGDQVSKAVGFHVPVPELGDELALAGARKCRLCGHLMALIRYTGDEGPISFFVVPKTRLPVRRLEKHRLGDTAFYAVKHKELEIVFWQEGDVSYAMAGSVGEDRLLDLACQACGQVRTACGRMREVHRVAGSNPAMLLPILPHAAAGTS